jgi:hypothetical protein
MSQVALPSFDIDGLNPVFTWGSNTDNTPPDRYPYVDGSQAPAGFLNDFAGFNQGTFNFGLTFAALPASATGWKFEVTYRWTGGVGLQDPANFLTLILGSGFNEVSQIITSVGAPAFFTTVDFPWTAGEINSLGSLTIFYYVKVEVSGLPTFWDINTVRLIAPDAGPAVDIEITGDGGYELGNEGSIVDYVGVGGIEIGQGDVDTPLVVSADVSGMYTLVPGRRFDRVYSRNTDPDQTQDVAIPTPYVKTGYFGA